MPTPVFEPVNFTQADFEKLLANDEPYIPASRHRKRKPSSTLSIKEREQGLIKQSDEHWSGSKQSAQTKKNHHAINLNKLMVSLILSLSL